MQCNVNIIEHSLVNKCFINVVLQLPSSLLLLSHFAIFGLDPTTQLCITRIYANLFGLCDPLFPFDLLILDAFFTPRCVQREWLACQQNCSALWIAFKDVQRAKQTRLKSLLHKSSNKHLLLEQNIKQDFTMTTHQLMEDLTIFWKCDTFQTFLPELMSWWKAAARETSFRLKCLQLRCHDFSALVHWSPKQTVSCTQHTW